MTIKSKGSFDSSKNKPARFAIIISIVALFVSFTQLIVNSPFFIKSYSQAVITVSESDHVMFVGTPWISSNTIIENRSQNIANNVELSIIAYSSDQISFGPDRAFETVDSTIYNEMNTYRFKKSSLVPGEIISVSFSNHIDSLAARIEVPELKPLHKYNCQYLIPHVEELKSDFGIIKTSRPEDFYIILLKIEKVFDRVITETPL